MNKTSNYLRLVNDYGTPCYIFDECGFIENMQSLVTAMREVYPRYRMSYSYKTNYTPYICKLAKEQGAYAEVVSDMELTLALRLGYSNTQIIYNGPEKGVLLEAHICNGGIVNIDNFNEAFRISQIAKRHPEISFKVGIRINMHLDDAFISRFGMEIGGKDIERSIKVLKEASNISIAGLHCHISRHRGLESWRQRAAIMIDAVQRYIPGVPEYISLGSGMFADMDQELKDQFGEYIPSYVDYAKAVLTPFAEFYKDTQNKPIILTEPGTTVVARYIDFIATVKNIKTIRDRRMAVLNGSFENLGEICGLKRLPVINLSAINNVMAKEKTDLVGYTCLEQDLMLKGYNYKLKVGDNLVFQNVGAYSIVSKPQFIHPNCPMYVINKDGEIREIMRAETFEDVFAKFIF